MSPMMIESIATAELAEQRERAARLGLRRRARAASRRPGRPAAASAIRGRSVLSRLHLPALP